MPMRDATIFLQVMPEQLNLIDRAAKLVDKNPCDFVLDAACENARTVLMDQTIINVDVEKLQQFVALLDAPSCPNPGLDRLMAIKPPWDTNLE
jgi:uncharacterized protein (DUF1778 family)